MGKMLIAISQRPKWRLQIASFVQPTVQNPKTLHLFPFIPITLDCTSLPNDVAGECMYIVSEVLVLEGVVT